VKYLSHATSTFILRITRDHFRFVWAALTFMNRVPIKDGLPCIFRVVRVSGTIRKVEEEAIRRARLMVLAAEEHLAGKQSTVLKDLFGEAKNPLEGIEAEDALDEDGDVEMDD
jgi:ribonuclease P/MRP protein subunit POP5